MPNEHQVSPAPDSPYFPDGESSGSNSGLKAALWIFIVLFIAAAAFAIYQLVTDKSGKALAERDALKAQVQALNARVDSLFMINDLLMEHSNKQEGVFFEVQIGAFKHFDLKKYQDAFAELKAEEQGDLEKYSLGKFRSYEQAKLFRQDIVEMGIKDAFIIAKVDGKRVPVRDALRATGQ